ncbi:glycosyltransferase [Nocardia iowensis]|uniref:Glycosyltransferase n=1 Tax=Nocardia iowensis TaxID=204891 RepID=A0ABX8RUQ1_NOCIO|nr:glycosyltransferase [Nocardia iowensis]QXN93268.1 glycosyltransferase [Nocardia iowensis]
MSASAVNSPIRTPELVSVIIPVYNGLPDLDVQLAGLAEQDYQGPFEVIISDNEPSATLRAHIDSHPLADRLRLRYLDSSDRPGGPYARNNGAAAASGDFLVFTDQDDRAHPGWLSALVRAAADYDAVGGALENTTLNSPEVATWRPVPPPEIGFPTHYLPFAHGNNAGYWRAAFEKIGGFDESLDPGEDMDISWRVQQAGLTLGHVPDAMMAYRLRSTHQAVWKQAVVYGHAATNVFVKHAPLGCPRPPLSETWTRFAIVVRHNPWIRLTRNRIPRGQWLLHTGVLVGRIQASFRHRKFYL